MADTRKHQKEKSLPEGVSLILNEVGPALQKPHWTQFNPVKPSLTSLT